MNPYASPSAVSNQDRPGPAGSRCRRVLIHTCDVLELVCGLALVAGVLSTLAALLVTFMDLASLGPTLFWRLWACEKYPIIMAGISLAISVLLFGVMMTAKSMWTRLIAKERADRLASLRHDLSQKQLVVCTASLVNHFS